MGLESTGSNPVFPNIFSYVQLFNNYKIAAARNVYFFKIKHTNVILKVLRLFKELGLVKRFYTTPAKLIYVFPTFFHKKVYKFYFRLYARETAPILVSYKALRILKKTTYLSTMLLETDKGILTHQSALGFKRGGKLIAIIN